MTADYVKKANGFSTTGKRDDNGNLFADCTCQQFYMFGFQDRSAMMAAVKTHSAHHVLKIAAKR